MELHKRVQGISPIYHICHNAEESSEYFFILCPLARAVWIGTDLSIKTEAIALNTIKDWIQDWLSKPNLTNLKALWFCRQFIYTLWSIWIHRNKVVFREQNPNPIGVIYDQKDQFRWIFIDFHCHSEKAH